MSVSVEGPGTVGAQPDYSDLPSINGATIAEMEATDKAYFKWYEGYQVKISGATKDTRIKFERLTELRNGIPANSGDFGRKRR